LYENQSKNTNKQKTEPAALFLLIRRS